MKNYYSYFCLMVSQQFVLLSVSINMNNMTWRIPILLCCVLFFLLQCYEEISLYLRKEIFSTTSIEQLQSGDLVMVFCRNPPVQNHSLDIMQLQELIIRPVSAKIEMKKLVTLYKGVCLAVQADFLETVESMYLYYDWGKRYLGNMN